MLNKAICIHTFEKISVFPSMAKLLNFVARNLQLTIIDITAEQSVVSGDTISGWASFIKYHASSHGIWTLFVKLILVNFCFLNR